MRVQNLIIISLFASFITACSQETKPKLGNVEVKEITSQNYHVQDEISPPPPDITSNFKSLEDWLFSICEEEKPKKAIANYEFGLFESPENYTIFLVGVNIYDKGDTSYTRIEFEPSNMYFSLPNREYKDLTREELLDRLVSLLKEFTETKKFKTSFFTQAVKITFEANGQTIWSKAQ